MTASPLVEIADVTYQWPGASRTLGPLTANVTPGRWVALIGPNGTGKSTLLRLVGGYWKPRQGCIRLRGQDVSTLRAVERSRLMAFVPQTLDTSFELTVREIVQLGCLNRLSWRDRWGLALGEHDHVNRLLDETELGGLADRSFATLSGGEAKRALLAAALVQGSPLLLLDEPTTHLDPGHAKKFLDLVRRHVDSQGLTVIMAYHDLTTVGLYADEIWVMDQGQLVLQGSPPDVLTDPMLSTIYGTELMVLTHPRTQLPMLLFP